MTAPIPPRLDHVCTIRADIAPSWPTTPVTGGPHAEFVPITGGTVAGALTGVVLPGGGDRMQVRGDVIEVDAHYHLRLTDGSVVEVRNRGVYVPQPSGLAVHRAGGDLAGDDVYFRTTPVLHSAAPAWAWLADTVFTATAGAYGDHVVVEVFRVR